MDNQNFTLREEILEIVNRLFVYTDEREWERLQSEVFAPTVEFDMASLGGPKQPMPASDICAMWAEGLKDLDHVNHLTGNHLVKVTGKMAEVFCYGRATHYNEAANDGKSREIVGTYDLRLTQGAALGWRIDGFRFNHKYTTGNAELQ